jgi:multiple sugar transport system permease protein
MRFKQSIAYSPIIPYLFIAPAILFFIFFSYSPIVQTFILSFKKWDILRPVKPFVGLSNFQKIFTDPVFWISLKNTFYFTFVYTAVSVPLALLMARAIIGIPNRPRLFIRSAFFVPVVSMMVAVGFFWRIMYDKSFGVFNMVLGDLFGVQPIGWLTDPKMIMDSIIIMSVWKSLGATMIIFLAGLDNIPTIYYESALIDGANRRQVFFGITLPLLKPATIFVLITTIIGAFQVFTQVWVLSGLALGMHNVGGPGHASRVLVMYIYQKAFNSLKMGVGSAMALILFVIILVFTLLQLRIFRSEEAIR